jgi:hypothetical protein
VPYLDDGKTEKGVPADELRLTSELNKDGPGPAPVKPLPLPLEGLLYSENSANGEAKSDAIAMTPRATVHRSFDDDREAGEAKCGNGGGRQGEGKEDEKGRDRFDDDDSTVFVVEGQQQSLATGGGVRGIRFLRNSTRA